MKRPRGEDEEVELEGTRRMSGDHPSVGASKAHERRRLVKGADVGLPFHASVIEEVCVVEEVHTVLVRFPCFDFFRHVRLCEGTRDPLSSVYGDVKSSATLANDLSDTVVDDRAHPPTSSCCAADAVFVPEAAFFIPGTLETDTPQLLLNSGTPHEMRFEGQWAEVAGEGACITNRAIVHVSANAREVAASPGARHLQPLPTASAAAKPSELAGLTTEALPASSSPATAASAIPVASLLTHTFAGVTADEERRLRAEQQKGWTYDRIDVPSAVLVMHRVH
ncbi:hypothetical protein JKF63_03279 [Porcisia hertigi]|uniref:Uncharacterized protein n=1 Tax=Porcisia hertigi TaxID=2761500 RepID=A0A836ID31_9TRYP|nr:hypothetical protein JKF63_03279 [Porcisia hertigi]